MREGKFLRFLILINAKNKCIRIVGTEGSCAQYNSTEGRVNPIGVNLSGVPRGSRPLAGYKGCPQTPAGRTLHPLGKGVALKLMTMGFTPAFGLSCAPTGRQN